MRTGRSPHLGSVVRLLPGYLESYRTGEEWSDSEATAEVPAIGVRKLFGAVGRVCSSVGPRVVLLADNKMSKYRAVADSSADECVSVPLAPGEIGVVIASGLARPHDAPSSQAGDILINSSAMRVVVGGKEITTTTLEFRLLHYMARHQGEAFTRDALLDADWGDLQFVTARSVDACVRRIRRKIEPNSSSPTFLKSVRGVGCKLEATPVWETSADCECAACPAARMRTKIGPMRQVGHTQSSQDRLS